MSLGWVSLHRKGALQGKSLAISRNWPSLGGAVYSQQDARAITSRTQEVRYSQYTFDERKEEARKFPPWGTMWEQHAFNFPEN